MQQVTNMLTSASCAQQVGGFMQYLYDWAGHISKLPSIALLFVPIYDSEPGRFHRWSKLVGLVLAAALASKAIGALLPPGDWSIKRTPRGSSAALQVLKACSEYAPQAVLALFVWFFVPNARDSWSQLISMSADAGFVLPPVKTCVTCLVGAAACLRMIVLALALFAAQVSDACPALSIRCPVQWPAPPSSVSVADRFCTVSICLLLPIFIFWCLLPCVYVSVCFTVQMARRLA